MKIHDFTKRKIRKISRMKDQEVVISGIQDFLEFKYDGENIKIENFSHSNFVSNPFDQLTNE